MEHRHVGQKIVGMKLKAVKETNLTWNDANFKQFYRTNRIFIDIRSAKVRK